MAELENVDEERGRERVELSPSQLRLLPDPPKGRGPGTAGPEHGWPPQPKDVTNLRIEPLDEGEPVITDDLRGRLRDVALASSRVTPLLSDRVDHVGTAVVAPPKGEARRDAEVQTRVFFFDHERKVTVQVTMHGTAVVAAEAREGFQTSADIVEIERAIDLARRDPRLNSAVGGQIGEAILMQADPSVDPLGHHRVLYVGFYHDVGGPPTYGARVDLTAGKVLSVVDHQR
jgi:hypothetical protein